MEAWLAIVVRQTILYSLPVVVSLSVVGTVEAMALRRHTAPPAFPHNLAWQGAWLPLAASIAFGRALIIALPRPVDAGVPAALFRLMAHLGLCLIGWLLYALALAHTPPVGPPPLHQWWAKVLMFFNLCMTCLHLLPLPGMLTGEYLLTRTPLRRLRGWLEPRVVWVITALAATPLLDIFPGHITFRLYEVLVNQASGLTQ